MSLRDQIEEALRVFYWPDGLYMRYMAWGKYWRWAMMLVCCIALACLVLGLLSNAGVHSLGFAIGACMYIAVIVYHLCVRILEYRNTLMLEVCCEYLDQQFGTKAKPKDLADAAIVVAVKRTLDANG